MFAFDVNDVLARFSRVYVCVYVCVYKFVVIAYTTETSNE